MITGLERIRMLSESDISASSQQDEDRYDIGVAAVRTLRLGQAQEREKAQRLKNELTFAFSRLKAICACVEWDHGRCFDVELGRKFLDLALPHLVEINALDPENRTVDWCLARVTWWLPGLAADMGRAGLMHEWSRHSETRSIAVANQFSNPENRGKPLFWLPRKDTIVEALGLTQEKIDAINAWQKRDKGKAAIRFGAGPSQTPEERRARQNASMTDLRRKNGVRARSECTKTKDLEALAVRAGCSLSTIKRHDRKGTLVSFLADKGVVQTLDSA
ncbi:hypothetical protein [Methylorubrum extorquens]